MKRLPCLTPFLIEEKKFKLPSGETYDSLRYPKNDSTDAADSSFHKSESSPAANVTQNKS